MYQLLENKTECLDCDVMHFGNKSGLSFCSICPWGWEALTNGSAGCSTCPVGKHGDPSKTRGCHYCSEGQYRRQDDVGQLLKCRQCTYLFCNKKINLSILVLLIFFTLSYIFSFIFTGPGGWSQPKYGMGECVQCGQGQYQQDIEQTECVDCGINYFTSGPGETSCTSCPRGFQTTSMGVSSCSLCGEGQYGNSTSLGCFDCETGRFRPNGDMTHHYCHLCPLGWRQPSGKKGQCLKCKSGKANHFTEQLNCMDCRINEFSDLAGEINCTLCPAGYRNLLVGGTICESCPIGKYGTGIGKGCEFCTEGRYRKNDKTMSKTDCIDCKLFFFYSCTVKYVFHLFFF